MIDFFVLHGVPILFSENLNVVILAVVNSGDYEPLNEYFCVKS